MTEATTAAASSRSSRKDVTLAEQAYLDIKRDIIAGDLPGGRTLRLEFLKGRYGVSYSPLREALNRLLTERLVVLNASRGFCVAPFSEEEMWDAIETRIVIDCEALRRSLARGDDAWETRLVESFKALTQASADRNAALDNDQDPDWQALEQCHHQFHHNLIAASGSRWLMQLSDQLYTQTERYRRPSLFRQHYRRVNRDRDVGFEHQQLLNAALARDAVLAAGLLARHYRESGRIVRRVLEEAGAEGAAVRRTATLEP